MKSRAISRHELIHLSAHTNQCWRVLPTIGPDSACNGRNESVSLPSPPVIYKFVKLDAPVLGGVVPTFGPDSACNGRKETVSLPCPLVYYKYNNSDAPALGGVVPTFGPDSACNGRNESVSLPCPLVVN